MYGVILWSDEITQKAVIWCEDHGRLAYFNPAVDEDDPKQKCEPRLGVGDLIQFHVRDQRAVRRASRVKLVAAAQFPELAGGLGPVQNDIEENEQPAELGNVIAFRKAPNYRQSVPALA